MKAAIYLLTVAILALVGGTAKAQFTIPTDIGVTLIATPTADLVPGQLINFTLTVTNYGPASTSLLVLDSSDFTDQIAQFVTGPNECYLVGTVVDAVVPYSYLSWYVAGLPGESDFEVGKTLTCHFQFALSAQSPVVWSFSFSVSTFDPDLNPSNDNGTVILQRAIDPIPVLSSMMLWVLAILLVTMTSANWHSRSRL